MATCRCGKTIKNGRRRCKQCNLQDRYSTGPVGGRADDSDEDDEWDVEQTGLGDCEAEGQASLDGGIVRDGEGGDEA